MDNTVTSFNENTSLIEREGNLFVKKRISADDAPLFQKLLKTDSPFLAKVFELCFDEKHLYAIMEYIPGKTLSEAFEEHGATELKSIIKLALNVCEGVSVLHKNGIIHRDINPNNIVIRPDGRAVIIDYGISRIEKEEKQRDTTILGTAGWTAPEQFGFRQTNARSDIYAIGVLLNYLQNGKMPNEEIPKNELSPIIKRCTLIKPEERFGSADELADALKLIYNRKYTKEKIPVKKPRIKRLLLGLYFAACCFIITVFDFFIDTSPVGEKICFTCIVFFGLMLPVFSVDFFNSKSMLFFYCKPKVFRIAVTSMTVTVSLITAIIIIIYSSSKWAAG